MSDPTEAARRERLVDVDDHEAARAADVGVVAGDGYRLRAAQGAIGIERHGAGKEVVRRVAVQQRGHAFFRVADDNQAFVLVADVQERVDQVDRLSPQDDARINAPSASCLATR